MPILAASLSSDDANISTVAWAWERPDGGRGFGFTGCHTHGHLLQEDYRRSVLNAILWTARIQVPAEGVISTVPPDRQ